MKLLKTEKVFASLVVLLALGINTAKAATPAALAAAKESGKVYHRFSAADSDVRLLPDSEFSEETKNYVFGNITEKTGFAAESLYYVSKKDLVEKSQNEEKSKVDTSITSVSKIVRSISKMKGMQYYSNTRKRYETLYLESYRIENPNSKNPVPDLLDGSSDGKTMYSYQDEHTFGKAIYKIQYRENSKMVMMKMENANALTYGIIKAVDPEKCKIVVNVIDDGEGYYVYLGMSVDFMQLAMLENKMNRSFQARLDAIFNWITLQF